MNIPQLTFTRFLAAFGIVVLHFGLLVFPFNLPWVGIFVNHFVTLVSYFFTLSGFILMVSNKEVVLSSQPLDKKKFWINRFARIYPVYFVALLIVFFLVKEADCFWDYFGWNKIMVNHLLMLQAWNPDFVMYYNYPAWSLSVELFFYLTFPFLLSWFQKFDWKQLVYFSGSLWFISMVVFFFLKTYEVNENSLFYFPLLHLANFVAGVCAGLIFVKYQDRLQVGSIWIHVSTFLVLAILIFVIKMNWLTMEYSRGGLFLPFFIMIIYSVTYSGNIVRKILSARPMMYLGEISYSIYLFQVPIAIAWFEKTNALGIQDLTARVWIYLLILLIVSAIAYETIEKPLRAKIRKGLGSQSSTLSPS